MGFGVWGLRFGVLGLVEAEVVKLALSSNPTTKEFTRSLISPNPLNPEPGRMEPAEKLCSPTRQLSAFKYGFQHREREREREKERGRQSERERESEGRVHHGQGCVLSSYCRYLYVARQV